MSTGHKDDTKNNMQLVITEKPSVARDLAKILKATKKSRSCIEGPDLKITWCFGHMCELETPEHYRPEWKQWKMQTLPMIPSQFDIKLRKDVQDHWKAMEKMLQLFREEYVCVCVAQSRESTRIPLTPAAVPEAGALPEQGAEGLGGA